MNAKINLTQKLSTFTQHWAPRTVAVLNDYDIMVVKLLGQFAWHKHDNTDELFLVLLGTLDIELRDRVITLRPVICSSSPKASNTGPTPGSKSTSC